MNKKFKSAKDRLILSLDFDDIEKSERIVKELKPYISIFKVGIQLFSSVGPKVIKMIQDEGATVYFDGKFHDIPNTVAKASEALVEKGINFFSIHISGGSKMMKACADASYQKAIENGYPEPVILGVTILTSIGQKTLTQELGVETDLQEQSIKLAKIARDCGLKGVVASACEAKHIRKKFGDDFIILTPAIRPTWAIINDQMRVLTPKEAIESGADYLLVGRPITQSKDPIAAVKLIIDEIEEAIEGNI